MQVEPVESEYREIPKQHRKKRLLMLRAWVGTPICTSAGTPNERNKWKSKTLKCIVVGKCNKPDGLLFYHPPSKQLITAANGYCFNMTHPSGPDFNSFTFHTKGSLDFVHRPPTHEEMISFLPVPMLVRHITVLESLTHQSIKKKKI